MPLKRLSDGFLWKGVGGLEEDESEGIGRLLGLCGLGARGGVTIKEAFQGPARPMNSDAESRMGCLLLVCSL